MSQEFPYFEVRENEHLLVGKSLIMNEAARRGISVSPFPVKSHAYFLLEYDGHKELFRGLDCGIMGIAAGNISSNKHNAKWALKREGICVPEGEVFTEDERGELSKYADGKIVTVKPNCGMKGNFVYPGIDGRNALSFAEKVWESGEEHVIVEDYYDLREHRVYVTEQGFTAVIGKFPASVVGDGVNDLEQLAAIRTAKMREHGTSRKVCLDGLVDEHLASQGKDLGYVPEEGEEVILKKMGSLSRGGVSVAYDNSDVDPKVKEIALGVLNALPGMKHAGIDLMCDDISNVNEYVVLEVNKGAGIVGHYYPDRGEPQNIAGALVDLMFPETIGI